MPAQLWETIGKYGPWSLLGFLVLYGLYKGLLPVLVKLVDGFLDHLKSSSEAQQRLLEDQLKRAEEARQGDATRFFLALERRDQMATEFHREQIQTLGALQKEVKVMGERLIGTKLKN